VDPGACRVGENRVAVRRPRGGAPRPEAGIALEKLETHVDYA